MVRTLANVGFPPQTDDAGAGALACELLPELAEAAPAVAAPAFLSSFLS